MKLIFDASPIIVLAKAGLLENFLNLGIPSLLSQAVADEIASGEIGDPARTWLKTVDALARVVPSPPVPEFLSRSDLGAGETSVISLAADEEDCVAVLDDLAARRCAIANGIKIVGTIGLTLLAKKRRLVNTVADPLEKIIAAGLYIAEKDLAEIRKRAGEY